MSGLSESQRKAMLMEGCRRALGNCRRCDLCDVRQNLVFGGGDPDAPIMIVGSNVTKEEDESGVILNGDHGGLVGQALHRVGLSPLRDVFATVVIKCQRPKTIRDGKIARADTTDEQREACAKYVRWQVEIVKPAILVAHGKLAAEVLFGEQRSFGEYAGSWRTFGKTCVALTTHNPAGLLFGERRMLIGEFMEHWYGVAERLDLLGRMWKPHARCFQEGWALNAGLVTHAGVHP